eukprot:scaffold7125_cov118-Isochrysis_galbana.AAC.8
MGLPVGWRLEPNGGARSLAPQKGPAPRLGGRRVVVFGAFLAHLASVFRGRTWCSHLAQSPMRLLRVGFALFLAAPSPVRNRRGRIRRPQAAPITTCRLGRAEPGESPLVLGRRAR